MTSYNLNSTLSDTMFVMTVDVESDDAWRHPDKIALKNLSNIPAFQACCEVYGIVPTYLVTYECATRDEAVSVLKPIADAGKCEIGHHLHAWTTPPFEREDPPGIDSAWLQAYQYELPDSLFMEKAECLRREIEKTYGLSPISHRAGRWGIDQRSVDWLIRNGFVAESSVVPLLNWSQSVGKTTGGPSYYRSQFAPFAWRSSLNGEKQNSFLMEIPLSVYVPHNFLLKLCIKYLQTNMVMRHGVDRFYRKLIGGSGMLRPDPHYKAGMLKKIVAFCLQRKMPVLNCMIHSSELAVACSPFTRNVEDCEHVWKTLEEVFRYVNHMGLSCVTLSQSAHMLCHSRTTASLPDTAIIPDFCSRLNCNP